MPARALLLQAFRYALLAAAAVPAAVGDWVSYSDYGFPTALVSWHGELFAGTGGGIRRIDPRTPYPFRETDYNNMQGLTDVHIVAFAVDAEDRLWAGSRSGQLFRLEGKTWSAWGKSYASAGWNLNPRAMAAAGRYLILGSEQGLSLFDRKSGTAVFNLTRFGKAGKQSVTSVLPAGDTLYIVAGGSVLYARFDWNDANSGKYGSAMFDPAIWKPVQNPGTLPDWVLHLDPADSLPSGNSDSDSVSESAMVFADTGISDPDTGTSDPDLDPGTSDTGTRIDTLAFRAVELSRIGGALVAHDTGTLLDTPHRIKALLGRQNYIDGKTTGRLTKCVAAAIVGEDVFLGGEQGIWLYRKEQFAAWIDPPGPIPSSLEMGVNARLSAVSARGGDALLMSGFTIYRFGHKRVEEVENYDLSPEVVGNELRSLVMLPDGGFLYGSWGQGLVRTDAKGEKRNWRSTNSCLKSSDQGDWTVVHTLSEPSGNDLWFTLLENVKAEYVSLMAHLDLATNTVSCPDVKGDNYHTYATRILSDSLFAVAGDRTMRIYRYGIGGVKTNIEPFGLVTGGNGTDDGRDMQMDGYGRLWALMNGRMGFVDSLAHKVGRDKKLAVEYLDGFSGVNCTAMEKDARGGLWAACENGIHEVSPGIQIELTRIERYTVNDGLLADRVIDLSVDPLTGKVWATTERGVNIFQSHAQPLRYDVEGVRAYPNPFRARHRMLVIDNLPVGATGAIFSQSGDAVRRFQARDMIGNQFQWDGKNAAGRAVTPGVYFYSVSADGKSSRGKIIVAR